MFSVGVLVNSFRESLKFRFSKVKTIDLRLYFYSLVMLC